MKKYLATAMLLCIAHSAIAQCNLQLSGHVEDSDSHETLVNATVKILELNLQQVTDANGDFIFPDLCAGAYTIEISHVGCETIRQQLQLRRNRHIDVHLPHLKNLLEEVTVSGQAGTPNTGFQQQLRGRELFETRGNSLSEALTAINGVTLLQTGSTISKPVIHGLHSNRILTINNGVRHEGQQWGNEHAPEIDPFIAEELSVVKGVEALRYGSDGIGGVVLIEPAALRYNEKMSGELTTGFFSNNRQYFTSGMFEQHLKKIPALSYRIQGSFKQGATIQTPNYRLNNTATNEHNFSILAGWRKQNYSVDAFYSRVRMQTGIFTGAHIGNLTDLLEAINSERPDPVYLGSRSYSVGRPKQEAGHQLMKIRSTLYSGNSKFQLILAAQDNDRQEFDYIRSGNDDRPQQHLSLRTLSQDLVWEHGKIHNLRGSAGISLAQKDHRAQGRYFIPNYRSASYGIFWLEEWSKNKWSVQGGARYDYRVVNTRRLRFGGAEINHDFDFSTLAASLNLVHRFSNAFKANLMASLANRAPDINELLSDGIHHGTATYEQGDIALKPEHAINTGLGLSYSAPDKGFNAEVYLYNNHIRDFIYRIPVPGDPVLTVAGAFPRIRFEQTNARLRGIDASADVRIHPMFTLGTKASVLRAWNKATNDWLILMPADRFTQSLTVDLPASSGFINNYIRMEYRTVLKQHRVPEKPGVMMDYKEPPPAYNLVSIQASTTTKLAHKPLTISLGVQNLFNTAYRDYMNSFRYFTDDMGRNISLRVKIQFD